MSKNVEDIKIDASNAIDRLWICIEILEGVRYGGDHEFNELINNCIDDMKYMASNRLKVIDDNRG